MYLEADTVYANYCPCNKYVPCIVYICADIQMGTILPGEQRIYVAVIPHHIVVSLNYAITLPEIH